MKKKRKMVAVLAVLVFVTAMAGCEGDTGGGGGAGVPIANNAPQFTMTAQPIFVARNAVFNSVVQQAADGDLPNTRVTHPGYLTCSMRNNACSFAVTVTGAGAGAVDCTASFTAPATGEVCSFDVVVRDGGGLSITDTIDVEVATVWYVDADATGAGTGLNWTDAFTNIQDAVLAAGSGDFIFVADGVYTPATVPSNPVVQMRDNVKIFGGFQGTESSTNERPMPIGWNTILDGEETSCHVVGGADYARLDGFYITSGWASGVAPCSQLGGGVYNVGVDYLELSNLTVAYNGAYDEGGGIFNQNSTISMDNLSLMRNVAYAEGGGIFNQNSTISMDNLSLMGNVALADGGGIFNQNSTISMDNLSLVKNFAFADGGGITNYGSTVSVSNSIFVYNHGGNLGGAIFNSQADVSITNSNILFNGIGGGGGIANFESYLTIEGAYIDRNTTNQLGGGILNSDSYLQMEDSTVIRNDAVGGGGGGVSNFAFSYSYINDSVFSQNYGYYGGGVLNYDYVISDVSNSTFENNYGYTGGAIMNLYAVSSFVDSSTFKLNKAYVGGAIASGGYIDTEITNSVFVGNVVYGYGGGVANWATSEAHILNTTFTGNAAYIGGGALANGPYGSSEISNTILWDDLAGYDSLTSEIFDYYVGASYVVYSDIMGGWGGYGYGKIHADPLFMNAPLNWDACIDTGTTTTLEVLDGSIYNVGDVIEIEMDGVARTVTDVTGNTVTFSPAYAVNTDGGMVVAIWGAGATNFVLDLSLQPGSPAIDAGWDTNGNSPLVDILGNPRPSGTTWDMGAYEYQQ